MDPLVPGQEYDLPSACSHPPGHQHPARRPPVKSSHVDGNPDLPPVIYRFQSHTTPPSSEKTGQQSRSKSNQPKVQSLLDLDAEVPPFVPRASTMQNFPDEISSFQMVNRAKPSRPQGQAPQKAVPFMKKPNNNDNDKFADTASEDPCKLWVTKPLTGSFTSYTVLYLLQGPLFSAFITSLYLHPNNKSLVPTLLFMTIMPLLVFLNPPNHGRLAVSSC